jgi:hypothetical protein
MNLEDSQDLLVSSSSSSVIFPRPRSSSAVSMVPTPAPPAPPAYSSTPICDVIHDSKAWLSTIGDYKVFINETHIGFEHITSFVYFEIALIDIKCSITPKLYVKHLKKAISQTIVPSVTYSLKIAETEAKDLQITIIEEISDQTDSESEPDSSVHQYPVILKQLDRSEGQVLARIVEVGLANSNGQNKEFVKIVTEQYEKFIKAVIEQLKEKCKCESELITMNERLDTIEEKHDELKGAINQVTQVATGLNQTNTSLNAALIRITNVEKMDARIATQDAKIVALEARIKALEGLEARIKVLETPKV